MKQLKFLNIARTDEAIDVFINGEICCDDAKGFYDFFDIESTNPKSFKAMLDEADGKPLTVHINSIGGDLVAGMAMYSAIKNYKGETTAIVDSICASAATLPMVSCKKVIMQMPSTMMIHQASLWGTGGNKKELEQDIEMLKSLDNSIANAYVAKTGLPRDEVLAMMEAETWLDSKKALELGFIDEIYGDVDIPETIMQNIIDNNKRLVACYRGFEHPKEKAPLEEDTALKNGSKLVNGKYANVEELEKAYIALQTAFTQKCQEKPVQDKAVDNKKEPQTQNEEPKADNTLLNFQLADYLFAKSKIGGKKNHA